MREIAIYGKGGIGKSTLSANITAALGRAGKRVLQIGCDPKHDSTKLLTGGRRITTVLDHMRETGALDHRLDQVLFTGEYGCGCIETGGPKPGVGCAGRGIISAFELLEKFHVKEEYDMVLYDVLGDVVCGGFAVPIRREYANTIFLVTSGEFMSLYAANNILRGIANYDTGTGRVAGILYNSRNVRDEDERVRTFAEAVGLPIFAKIPRSDAFAQCERRNCTIASLGPEGFPELYDLFTGIAARIIESPVLYPAAPLTDEALEELLLYGTRRAMAPAPEVPETTASQSPDAHYDPGTLSKNVIRNEPLHGCAFSGAASTAVHIRDAVILTHSPKSCTYLAYQSISSTNRRRLFERGVLLPYGMILNLASTEMEDEDMVFGGTDKLLDAVRRFRDLPPGERPKAVIIVSSCPSGIIGDDIDEAKALSLPDMPVIPIKAEGNLTGDYLQGMLSAYRELALQVIDRRVAPQPKTVNVVFEKVVVRNTEQIFRIMSGFLARMGIRVNCRFLCNTDFASLRNFLSAELNLLAYQDYTGKLLRDFFAGEYGCRFFDRQFPIGFPETAEWLRGVGAFFGGESAAEAEAIIAENRARYEEEIAACRSALAGKRLMVFTYNHDIDWILSAALDAGMEIAKICIFNFSQDEGFRTRLPEIRDIPVEENYDGARRAGDIAAFRPDIILSNYENAAAGKGIIADTIPMCPDNGFFAGLSMMQRWVRLFGRSQKGEWQNDRALFEKYFA
ncbi:MAG: AAA family ATPase [Eubacterium sp.]|nr:AAA family ATPase [Eubacterium sp.]